MVKLFYGFFLYGLPLDFLNKGLKPQQGGIGISWGAIRLNQYQVSHGTAGTAPPPPVHVRAKQGIDTQIILVSIIKDSVIQI